MYDEYGAEFEPETRFDEMLDETYDGRMFLIFEGLDH